MTLVRRDRSKITSPIDITPDMYEDLVECAAVKGEWTQEQARYRVLGVRRAPDGVQVEAMVEFLGYAIPPADIDC